jgi:hypothetical protein
MLANGTLPEGYTVKKRKLVKTKTGKAKTAKKKVKHSEGVPQPQQNSE